MFNQYRHLVHWTYFVGIDSPFVCLAVSGLAAFLRYERLAVALANWCSKIGQQYFPNILKATTRKLHKVDACSHIWNFAVKTWNFPARELYVQTNTNFLNLKKNVQRYLYIMNCSIYTANIGTICTFFRGTHENLHRVLGDKQTQESLRKWKFFWNLWRVTRQPWSAARSVCVMIRSQGRSSVVRNKKFGFDLNTNLKNTTFSAVCWNSKLG